MLQMVKGRISTINELKVRLIKCKFGNQSCLDKVYYKNKMSTTKILSQIEEAYKKQRPLQNYIPALVQSLESQKRVIFNNMNSKQKLSQLQQLIQSQLKKINQTLTQQNIDLENDEQDQVEAQVEQDAQEDGEIEAEEPEQDQEQFQQDQDNLEMEQEEIQAEDEFPEPDFAKTKNNQDQMIDEGDEGEQQQGEQEEQPEQGEQGLEQQAFSSEEDVGLYGEQLNDQDQDMENYDNQFDDQEFKEFQKQFGEGEQKESKKSRKRKNKGDDQGEENPDDNIDDNFDHFRQIQLENQKEQIQEAKPAPKTQLDNQIDKLQGKVIGKKDWMMKGQIKAKERPSNSLLEYDLQFSSGIKYSHQITEERNTQLQQLIKKRILSDMFDDRTRFVNTSHIREHFGSLKQVSRQKSQMGLGELYESQFKNFLGIGENKNEKLKAEIMDSFKELNYFLDSLSNFSFVPHPTKSNGKKGQTEAIVVEEKVPLTLWNGQRQINKDGKLTFESEKEVDKQAKRLKNKRIARQRKKQQAKKALNKKIQYGGITKFEAQVRKKAQMNTKPLKIDGTNMKYNKSSSFFKNINENKGGKPNPDISKMKI